MLYTVRDELHKLIPHRRIIAVRIGYSRDSSQEIYAENLIRRQSDSDEFLLNVWLPQNMLPLAQKAFDINFYWPEGGNYPTEAENKGGDIEWKLPYDLSFKKENSVSVIKAFMEETESPMIFLYTTYGTIRFEESS